MDKVLTYSIITSASKLNFKFEGDAGNPGFSVYSLNAKERFVSRPFSAAKNAKSSTFKELTACHETYMSNTILDSYTGERIAHYTDNLALVFILSTVTVKNLIYRPD